MYGTATQIGRGPDKNSLLESQESVPVYSCARAVKAVVKTVKFHYEAPECCDLAMLRVLDINNKEYSPQDVPYWGVEDWSQILTIEMPALWGLVDNAKAKSFHNISTIRSPYLYLPGNPILYDGIDVDYTSGGYNFPASFYLNIMASFRLDAADVYGGSGNELMARKWSRLSRNAGSAELIPNLIFADIAANGMVGVRSWFSDGGSGQVPVRLFLSHVAYHWLYAIPAFFTVAVGVIIAVLTAVCSIWGSGTPSRVRWYLDHLTAGRLLTREPHEPNSSLSPREWIREVGPTVIDLNAAYNSPMSKQEVTKGKAGALTTAGLGASPEQSNTSNVVSEESSELIEGEYSR